MKLEDYDEYYVQGSDRYLIPKDIFIELFEEMANFREENKKLKKQQKEFIEWLEKESKELIRDAGYHQRICLDIIEKYKEIIGCKEVE